MGKRFSKKEAVSIVISASRMYRDNFVGKRLLFLMTDKHKKVYSLEVGFDASNFQHLTGLRMTDPNCSHLDFYNRCVEGRMKASDIEFAANGTTHQKLWVLPEVFRRMDLSANMIGNYNGSQPLLYTEKLVGGVKWAVGFVNVGGGQRYVPNTLLEGDIRDYITDNYRIIAAYIKEIEEETFTKKVYEAKKIEYERLCYPDDWGSKPRLTKTEEKRHEMDDRVRPARVGLLLQEDGGGI